MVCELLKPLYGLKQAC
jgi:hypothetical protein